MILRQFAEQIQPQEEREITQKIMDKINSRDDSDLSSRLEDEFACLSGSTLPGVCYIDGGSLAHMTRVREYFSSYQEEQMDF